MYKPLSLLINFTDMASAYGAVFPESHLWASPSGSMYTAVAVVPEDARLVQSVPSA